PPAPAAPPAPSAPAVAEAFPAAPASAEPQEAAGDTLDSIVVTGTRITPPAETGDQARRRHQAAFAARAQARLEAERDAAEREQIARLQIASEQSASEQRAQAQAAREPEAAKAEAAAADAAGAATASAPPALPPVAADAALPLQDWFDRIRLRRDRGDLADARDSLAALRRAHPDAVLPDDLLDLR
ncbi:MAG TPA: hypothetical protein VFQ84_03570, partial [Arenimonas sp.]|nr:hypothetical protein [Arenimonas sp.]